jgi:hypothetical protein
MKANLEYPITLSTSMPSSSECSPYFFIVGCKKHSKAHSESVLSWYGRMPYVDSYYRIKDNLEERTYRKQIPLCDILQKIEGFLLKNDCDDKKADIYIFNKLYPYISKMFQDIVGLKG